MTHFIQPAQETNTRQPALLPIPAEIAALNVFSFALFPLVTSERGQWLQGGLPFPTFIVGF